MSSAATPTSRNILVVCFGNLCRSPMAEALLRARLPVERWRIRSAGTHAVGGSPPTRGARRAISEVAGLDISEQRSAPLTAGLLRDSEFVFTMSRDQAREAAALVPEAAAKIRLFGAFAPSETESQPPADPFADSADEEEVGDPMGHDRATYEACCERLSRATEAVADWLETDAAAEGTPPPVSEWQKTEPR